VWCESADDVLAIWVGHCFGGDVYEGVGPGLHELVFEEAVSAFEEHPCGYEEVEVAVEVDIAERGGHASGDSEDIVDAC